MLSASLLCSVIVGMMASNSDDADKFLETLQPAEPVGVEEELRTRREAILAMGGDIV